MEEHAQRPLTRMVLDLRRAAFLFRVVLKKTATLLLLRPLGLAPREFTYARAIRTALEELGLTYLKVGQFLAMRFDILPKELCEELNHLFESVAPVPFSRVKAAVERELGGPLERFYSHFETTSIAAASVGQVHEARTTAGRRVAVKVQRPGIAEVFASDMRNLRRIARVVDALNLGLVYTVNEMVDQFEKWTRVELDFTLEGQTADRIRANALPYEGAPEVYWALTTPRVLTMEFIEGLSLARVTALLEEGREDLLREALPDIDVALFGSHFASAVLHQLFVTGFFHGDPHPGNIFVQQGNRVVFVDFGIFGELEEEQRETLANQIESLSSGDFVGALHYLCKQYVATERTDHLAFRKEGMAILKKWHDASMDPGSSLTDRHIGQNSGELLQLAARHGLKGGAASFLFWRALYVLDASALKLSAHMDLMAELTRFFTRIRPGFSERLRELAADRERSLALARISIKGPDILAQRLDGLARGENPATPLAVDSASTERARNGGARWIAAAMAVVGAAAAAPALPLPAWALPLVVLAAVPLFVYRGLQEERG